MGPFGDGWTMEDVEAVIKRSDPNELRYVPIVVSMDPPDCDWSQRICVNLWQHADPIVRRNALLGFGHLARTCRRLDEATVRPIIENALMDEHLRGTAEDVVDDASRFLGWSFARTDGRG